MKISVLGNCQKDSLAWCLRHLLPHAEVIPILAVSQEAVKAADGSDYYFVQTDCGEWVRSQIKQDAKPASQMLSWPTFFFPAFHPDLVFGRVKSGELLCAGASYNSSIALYGFLKGLSVSDTLSLFCEAVYDRLNFFDYWRVSKQTVINELQRCKLDGISLFDSWAKTGCFAYSVNHPKLLVVASFAEELLCNAGIEPVQFDRRQLLRHDPLEYLGAWPVYPEIAERLGCEGSREFIVPPFGPLIGRHQGRMDLDQFVSLSFELYSRSPKEEISCGRLESQKDLYRDIELLTRKSKRRSTNPYSDLPDTSFWRRSIERVALPDVDPVIYPKFKLDKGTKIATGGSCFAQHIAKKLVQNNYNYFVTESAPADKSPEWSAARGFGLFSARYGNIYTARQLLQLVRRAYGMFKPVDQAWPRPDGRYVDPFRQQIEPAGFATVEDVENDRRIHLAAVRRMFETADVFVFTVGLTECWVSKLDGAVLPLAPGIVGGTMNPNSYEFVNFSVVEVRDDLVAAICDLKKINPMLRFILTVSPVPLVATYENRHVLTATTYSKAVLRVAVEEVAKFYTDVDYFPAYEVITGNFNCGNYFEDDKRSVTADGVAHVMRLFETHYCEETGASERGSMRKNGFAPDVTPPLPNVESSTKNSLDLDIAKEIVSNSQIICDEELLDAMRYDGC